MIKIIGAGGFASEVMTYLDAFEVYVEDEYYDDCNVPFAMPLSSDDGIGLYAIAIGDPRARESVFKRLSPKRWPWIESKVSVIDSSAIGVGLIACDFAVVTTNVVIGIHAHLNLHSSVGHDCMIGDFFTASPGARVSGNCTIGDRVFLGTNAVVNPGVSICSDVTIGSGCVVTKDINEPGTYIGIPAKKI